MLDRAVDGVGAHQVEVERHGDLGEEQRVDLLVDLAEALLGQRDRSRRLAAAGSSRSSPQAKPPAGLTDQRLGVGHPVPQRERLLEVAQRLERRSQRLGLGSRPVERLERRGEVVAGEAVVGQVGGRTRGPIAGPRG